MRSPEQLLEQGLPVGSNLYIWSGQEGVNFSSVPGVDPVATIESEIGSTERRIEAMKLWLKRRAEEPRLQHERSA
jgi:hypothetical protein